jgi:hypothetical protein
VRQEGRQRFYTLDEEYMTLCCCLLANQSVRNYKAQVVPIDSIEGGQC